MKNAFILVGISASGKSTAARSLILLHESYGIPVTEINRDNIRFRDIDPGGGWHTYNFTNQNEKVVTKIWDAELELAILRGHNLIFSDTNLKVERTKGIANQCVREGYKCHVKVLDIPVEECIERDLNRGLQKVGASVGEFIIRQQAEKLKKFIDTWDHVKYPIDIHPK
jgi:predicted kinase